MVWENLLGTGRALELGCGNGRNAIFGSGVTDRQAYERRRLGGGLGYDQRQLRHLWDRAPFSVRVLRQMRPRRDDGNRFGEDFLWAMLAEKVPAD